MKNGIKLLGKEPQLYSVLYHLVRPRAVRFGTEVWLEADLQNSPHIINPGAKVIIASETSLRCLLNRFAGLFLSTWAFKCPILGARKRKLGYFYSLYHSK